ncbi:MAG: DUF2971 domain-containing protein [Chthoniobacterales bacterium]
MRAYHLVNEQFGMDDLVKKRLKIATLKDLNDPFELFAVSLTDSAVRRAFRKMKDELSRTRGLLCFSRDWHNPVQWSHYADRHRGLCLGFDVSDESVGSVTYSSKRIAARIEQLRAPRLLDPNTAISLLFTKFSHWSYEDEVRGLVTLEDRDPATGLYFAEFSDRLRLREVIVGAASRLTRADIRSALGDLASTVTAWKARLAFSSFRIVRQRNERLWA